MAPANNWTAPQPGQMPAAGQPPPPPAQPGSEYAARSGQAHQAHQAPGPAGVSYPPQPDAGTPYYAGYPPPVSQYAPPYQPPLQQQPPQQYYQPAAHRPHALYSSYPQHAPYQAHQAQQPYQPYQPYQVHPPYQPLAPPHQPYNPSQQPYATGAPSSQPPPTFAAPPTAPPSGPPPSRFSLTSALTSSVKGYLAQTTARPPGGSPAPAPQKPSGRLTTLMQNKMQGFLAQGLAAQQILSNNPPANNAATVAPQSAAQGNPPSTHPLPQAAAAVSVPPLFQKLSGLYNAQMAQQGGAQSVAQQAQAQSLAQTVQTVGAAPLGGPAQQTPASFSGETASAMPGVSGHFAGPQFQAQPSAQTAGEAPVGVSAHQPPARFYGDPASVTPQVSSRPAAPQQAQQAADAAPLGAFGPYSPEGVSTQQAPVPPQSGGEPAAQQTQAQAQPELQQTANAAPLGTSKYQAPSVVDEEEEVRTPQDGTAPTFAQTYRVPPQNSAPQAPTATQPYAPTDAGAQPGAAASPGHVPTESTSQPEPQHQPQPQAQSKTKKSKVSSVAGLMASFAKAAISEVNSTAGRPPDTFPRAGGTVDDLEPYIPSPPMRFEGEPAGVTRGCVGSDGIKWETTWHSLPLTPRFLVCSHCHDRYIRPTALSASFERSTKPSGACRFGTPRLKNILWPAAVASGDLGPVQSYMERRVDIPDCKGREGVVSKDRFTWFQPAERDIPDFVACEACYEDRIVGTSFASRFEKNVVGQGLSEKWTCDLAVPYIKNAALLFPRDGDAGWAAFVEGATARMALPECKAADIVASSRKWFRPRQTVKDLDFCATCHMDFVVLTMYEPEFEEVVDTSATRHALRSCDLALIPTQNLLQISRGRRKPFSVVLPRLRTIGTAPRCKTTVAITGGRWYNFKQEVGNYGVCEACHAGILQPLELDIFYAAKPVQAPADKALYCAFNAATVKFSDFLNAVNEAIHKGVWRVYEDRVRRWAGVPACERFRPAGERAWWGWPDMLICHDCFETTAKDTPLAGVMPLQGEYADGERVCSLYSARMRALYAAACESRDTEPFLEVARARNKVYAATMPRVLELGAKVQAELRQAEVYRSISATHACAASMGAVFGGGPAVWVGGSYYSSQDSYAASNAWNMAMECQKRASDPMLMAEMVRLENEWHTVE